MAFATSLSAFGMKPPTAGGAYSSQSATSNLSPFSAFSTNASSSQQPSQTLSLFANPQNQHQNQNQPASGNLFTQQNTAQQPPQPSGGAFGSNTWAGGSTNAANVSAQPSQTSFSNWGQNNQQQNQNQQQQPAGLGAGGGIFGNPTGQHSQQSTGLGGNVFGNTSGQQQPQPSTGIFGNTGQPQPQQPFTSLFGNPAGQQQSQPSTGFSGGIFGSTTGQQQTQSQSGGLWGANTASTTGSSLFNQRSATQTAPQQQAQQQQFTRTTKFNDLPEQVQKTLEAVDAYIQGRIQISNNLKARSLDEEPTKGAELIRKVHNDLVNTMSALQADKAMAGELSSKVEQSVQDIIIAARIIDGFKNPQINGAYLKNHAQFPFEFFRRAAEEIKQKLQWYKSTIEQIERRLASAQNQVQYNPQSITATLQAQNATFLTLAGKTAELNAELQKVKASYRDLWRAHTGSARDPFNELDRRPGDGGGLLHGLGSLDLSR